MTNCDKAIDILQRTKDGRLLYQSEANIERYGRNGDGWQLGLIQTAVNNHLNESGKVLFAALHVQVAAGDYKYPLKEFVTKFCPEIA